MTHCPYCHERVLFKRLTAIHMWDYGVFAQGNANPQGAWPFPEREVWAHERCWQDAGRNVPEEDPR
jgi:hypothetical protein